MVNLMFYIVLFFISGSKGQLALCFTTTIKRLSTRRSAVRATLTYLEHAVVSFDCIQQYPNVFSRAPSSLLAHLSVVLDGVFSPALCLSFVHTRWGWVDSAPCVTSRRARVSRSSLQAQARGEADSWDALFARELGYRSALLRDAFKGVGSAPRSTPLPLAHILRIWRNA